MRVAARALTPTGEAIPHGRSYSESSAQPAPSTAASRAPCAGNEGRGNASGPTRGQSRNQREGKIKVSAVPAREITAQAEAWLLEDAEYRAELIADARARVEQWRVEGFFGKAAQNLTILHKE